MISVEYSNKNDLVYQKNVEILKEIESYLSLKTFDQLSPREQKNLLHEKVLPLTDLITHPVAAEYIFGMTVGYPNALVRSTFVNFVKEWLPYPTAVDTIISLTRDPDDLVCFKAIEICGEERIELALFSLQKIIGKASDRIFTSDKPVGFGAAKAFKAMTDIIGTTDPEEIKLIEEYFLNTGKIHNNFSIVEDIPQELIEEFEKQEEEGMILIPGGFFEFGLEPSAVPDDTFDWKDSTPSRKVWLPPFFIDKYPVTTEEYDAFVSDIKTNGHRYCHPSEPRNKDHTRNTYWDERIGNDLPVTGIDWYDAFAFSRWAGKELPTEFQWEKAARGPEGNIWPWGNEFRGDAVHWAGTLLNTPNISSLHEWRELLLTVSEEYPKQIIKPANTFENFKSPYGIVGMVGNHWEWTRSEFSTARFFSPGLGKGLTNQKHHSTAVLKGGSFSSLQGLLYPSFRGRDGAFCRHNEMGIRCVKEIPIHKIRQAIKKPITNAAIY